MFAWEETHLMIAIIIIASRHDSGRGMRKIHEKSWQYMTVSGVPWFFI